MSWQQQTQRGCLHDIIAGSACHRNFGLANYVVSSYLVTIHPIQRTNLTYSKGDLSLSSYPLVEKYNSSPRIHSDSELFKRYIAFIFLLGNIIMSPRWELKFYSSRARKEHSFNEDENENERNSVQSKTKIFLVILEFWAKILQIIITLLFKKSLWKIIQNFSIEN